MGNPEWEIIDDVLVPHRAPAPRRRQRRAGVRSAATNRAADDSPGRRARRRTAVSADEAGPSKKRAHAPSVFHARGGAVAARAGRDVSCDAPTAAKAGGQPPAHPAARSGVSSEAKKTTVAFSETPRRVCLHRETPHLERERGNLARRSPRWTKAWRARTRRTVSAPGRAGGSSKRRWLWRPSGFSIA